MNGAQIQSYITQNYPGLGNLTNEQIQQIQNSAGGGQPGMIDQAIKSSPQYQAYTTTQAQQQYQQGINTAVTGLQGQQTNLQQSYGSLLQDVMGQGSATMNTTTSGENAYLASRGLVSNAGQGNNQLSAAQLAVQSQNQAAAGSIGQGSAADMNAIQQSIAGIQAGGAGTSMQIPLNYGSLQIQQNLQPGAIALQNSQNAYQTAQAQQEPYINIANGNNLFNSSNGQATSMLQALAKSMGYNISS